MTEPEPPTPPPPPFGDDPLEEQVVASRDRPPRAVHGVPGGHHRARRWHPRDARRGGSPRGGGGAGARREGRLLLVRQWRIPAGQALLEIPAGTLDVEHGVTEDPDLAARRELEEETGHRAGSWRKLSTFWTAPGFASELMHLYLATGLDGVADDDGRLTPDEDERLELSRLTIDEALALVDAGGISDAKSILGILWLDRLRRDGEL